MNLTLPAGTYFIGDPRLVLDRSWPSVLAQADGFRVPTVVEHAGQPLFGAVPASSRHVFTDQNGMEYLVNYALGAVPLDLVEDPHGEELGTVVEAPTGLHVAYVAGVFTFGSITISTRPPTHQDRPGDLDLGPGE